MGVFRFNDSRLELAPPHFQARIPIGIRTKDELLSSLRVALRLPDYFGRNWDALWDCICDLSWIPDSQVVVLHRDLPLDSEIGQLQTYLSILHDAARYWEARRAHDLVVVFPSWSRDRVSVLLAGRSMSSGQQ